MRHQRAGMDRKLLITFLVILLFGGAAFLGFNYYIERQRQKCVEHCLSLGLRENFKPPRAGLRRRPGKAMSCTCLP